MSEALRRRFPWWVYWLAFLVILALALWPVAGVVLAGWLAETHGCALDEGSIHPCVIGGRDWGGDLYTLFVLGWFMLATLPFGAMALAVWFAVLVVHLLWRRRRRRQP
jgi:hypothetical protein